MYPSRKKNLLLQIPLLLFCLSPFLVSSQTIKTIIKHDKVNVYIEQWAIKNRLSSGPGTSTTKILQDSRGFMWICLNNSLARFDGKDFKEYSFGPDYQGILKQIAEDISGNLWLYCSQHGILIFSPLQECFYTIEEYLEGNTSYPSSEFLNNIDLRILSIEKDIFIINDKANQVWKYDGQLQQVFKGKPLEFQYYLPGPDDLFWRMPIYPSKQDTTWLVDAEGEPVQVFPDSMDFRNHFIDANYQLWNVNHTADDVNQPLDLKEVVRTIEGERTSAIPRNIYALHPYYHTSSHSDYILYGDQEKMTLLKHDQVIIDDIWPLLRKAGLFSYPGIYNIEVSKDGDFWIPCNGSLLHIRFKEKKFAPLIKGYSIRHISAIEKDRKILVSGYEMSPLLIDLQQETQEYITVKSLDHGYLDQGDFYHYSSYLDKNYIWFGSSGPYIHQYDYTTRETTAYELDPLIGSEARSFYFLTDSTFLFCSTNGVYTYNHKIQKLQPVIEETPGYWIHEDQKGDVWVATGKGLYHLPTQQYYLDSLDNHPLSVQHIYEAPNGNFWLSSNQGLVHWKPFGDVIQKISMEDGISNNTIHAAYPDQRGVLWLSTNYGVSAFDPKSNHIQNFFDTDGLLDNELNYLAHLSTSDGRLFFGGINGINTFYPDSIPLYEGSLYYDIYIGTTTLFDGNQQVLEYITPDSTGSYSFKIPPSYSQISIDVALPHFDAHQAVFQWRIPGVFNAWTDIKENQITLNGLPSGKYQLALRAYLINDPSRIITKQISIYKRAFFYQQTWFVITCVILFWITSWLLYRWRSKKVILEAKALENLVDKRTRELKQQKEIIEKQNHHLEEVSQAKNQLFNNIGHEFRTPLSLISGYSEQLLNHPNGPEWVHQPVSKIKKHTESLAEMIDEILSLQKIDSGAFPLQKSTKNWTALVKEQFNLFNGLAQKKQLIYRLEVVPDTPCIVAIDQKKVTRILQNLISNAIKYTPDKGQIVVRTEISEQEILFTVKDNGPGVLINEQEMIFKRFYQGQAAKGNAQPGYGIGLALSSEYAKLMEAALWVESKPNNGSTFFFRLTKEEVDPSTAITVAKPVPSATVETSAAIQSASSKNTDKKIAHLLIVEDNEELLAFLTDQLSKHYQVTAFKNGQLALDFLMQHKNIDLILSDVMMPVMDGLSLLKSVREEAELVFIPFIMLTALNDLPDKIEAFRLGVDSYLTKPFNLEELLARVANLIQFGEARKTYRKEKLFPDVFANEQSEPHIVSYDEEWMGAFDVIVEKELKRSDLKIVDLAYELHISERTLRNRLMEYTGMSPSEYITKARLKLAYPLVKQHKYATIAEVAYACGFKNTRYFSQQFKKEFGKSPAAY